jgi:hypothetical protein
LADLNAFTDPKALTAVAAVGPSLDEPDSVRYQWDDPNVGWLRTPDGSRFIYPNALNWAGLPTADTVQNNDEVGVDDLGYTGSSGVAQWHAATPEWRLIEGQFTSVADMLAFDALYPVHNLAIARVKSAAPFNDRSIVYIYHSGVWTRSGVTTTAGYAWTLSSLNDFSAIGLQNGDFGVYTSPAGGLPVILRYNSAVPRESGAGGGTVPAWLPPEVYAGTPRLQAYLVGTEAVTTDVTLNAQGWAVVSRTNGTLTSQTTRVRLATTTANGNVRIETQPNITATTKVYARALTRMQIGTGSGTSTAFFSHPAVNNGATGANPAYVSSDAAKGTFFWNGTGTAVSTGVDKSPQAAIAGLSSSDDMIEVIVNTAGGVRACELIRNGILVSTTDQVSAPGIADRVTYQAASFGSATTVLVTADISQVQVFTW